jgi:hypothetical protein
MQQRRLGPGDVLDDYCPRERRVTDHAIVAMIDDTIQQTRCVVCDAEHEYKQAKVPPQRKKKAPALFNQVLDGLKAPARPQNVPASLDEQPDSVMQQADNSADTISIVPEVPDIPVPALDPPPAIVDVPVAVVAAEPVSDDQPPSSDVVVEGPLFRRQLIRAALPRPEGTTPPARAIPEFTIRQPTGRHRHGGGGRRRAGHGQGQGQGFNGPMRFGRDGHGQRSNGNGRHGGHGRPNGHGGQGGHGNHGGPNAAGGAGRGGNRSRSRRGGKKR